MSLTVQCEIDFWGDGDRRLNVELDPAMVIRKLWSVYAKPPVVQNGDGTATEVAPASLGADAHAQTIRADDLAQAMVDAAVHFKPNERSPQFIRISGVFVVPTQFSSGDTLVPIWPAKPLDPQPVKEPEFALSSGTSSLIAGKPATEVDEVTRPTMTVYSPKEKTPGPHSLHFRGGFYVLAIDLEGSEVCDWLTSKGITCVLLKYRVPESGPHGDAGRQRYPKAPMALENAQRTFGADVFPRVEYHIDPDKIGVLGSSAGGYLVADISTNFHKRAYTAGR